MRSWAFPPVSQLAALLGVGQNIHGPRCVVDDWRAKNTNYRLQMSNLISATHTHVCLRGHYRMCGWWQRSYKHQGSCRGARQPTSMIRGCSALPNSAYSTTGRAALRYLGRPTVLGGARRLQQEVLRAHVDVIAGRVHVLPRDRAISNEVPGPHGGTCVCRQQDLWSKRCIRRVLEADSITVSSL